MKRLLKRSMHPMIPSHKFARVAPRIGRIPNHALEPGPESSSSQNIDKLPNG